MFSEQTMAATNKPMVCMKSLRFPDYNNESQIFQHNIILHNSSVDPDCVLVSSASINLKTLFDTGPYKSDICLKIAPKIIFSGSYNIVCYSIINNQYFWFLYFGKAV